MKSSRNSPSINSGSMADIAFLLLIFFLVTATISKDTGINRKLPKVCPPNETCDTQINERNILRIVLNSNDELLIEEKLVELNELKQITIDFIDNNGDGTCSYCNGMKSKNASDHPKKAVISMQIHPQSTYNAYVQVQNELTNSYLELRAHYITSVLKKKVNTINEAELKTVKTAYPFILSEADTQ